MSIGEGTASVGIKVNREAMTVQDAEAFLCGRRLAGRIMTGEDDPAQKELFEDNRPTLEGVFDVKQFSVKPKEIGAKLNFSLAEIDVEELVQFAKQSGVLEIDEVSELPHEKKGGDDDDAVGQCHFPDADSDQPWAMHSVSVLSPALTEAAYKAFREGCERYAVNTLGDLQGLMRKKGDFWCEDLHINKRFKIKIEDAFNEFLRQSEQAAEEAADESEAAGEPAVAAAD